MLAGNCDGFIGNRMLMYYGAEAEFLLEEGATPEQIDRVIEEFGFAMGPLAVRDLAGNDVGFAIRKRRTLPPDERWSPILERLVERRTARAEERPRLLPLRGPHAHRRSRSPGAHRGRLARAQDHPARQIPDGEILARLLHPLVNEGARLVEEGIAQRAGDVDVVYVYGYGFPAWRGGPMYWAEHAGLGPIVYHDARSGADARRALATRGAPGACRGRRRLGRLKSVRAAHWSVTPLALISALVLARGVAAEPAAASAVQRAHQAAMAGRRPWRSPPRRSSSTHGPWRRY